MNRVPLPTPEELNAKRPGTLFEVLGIEVVGVQDGRVELHMPVQAEHKAPNHYLHAGAIVSLADSACGMGCYAHLPEGAEAFTTVELKSNLLGTATEGELTCIAEPLHLGRTTQVWDAEVIHVQTQRTIARFRCTQMILWPTT